MDWSNGSGANLPALRGHNDALILGLLREAGAAGLGRTDLAARTGLTPQAVSKITARLRTEGLVAEAGRSPSTGGKPRTLLRLVPEARHAVGVHADRDELRAVRVDLTGTVVDDCRAPLDFGAGPDAVAEAVAAAVTRLRGDRTASLLGVGVAAPGPLDRRAGVLGRVTGHPEWDGFPLRQAVADRLGPQAPPVLLDKDTNAGAAAPARGAASGTSLYLHLGTGLGAGLRLDGEVYRGERSAAGEFGHQVLSLDGPPCRCGGDLAEAARILGEGAANVVALLDMDRVWLGGRVVAGAPEVFTAGVRHVLRSRTLGGPVPEVTVAETGVAEGAAELILAPLFGHPS